LHLRGYRGGQLFHVRNWHRIYDDVAPVLEAGLLQASQPRLALAFQGTLCLAKLQIAYNRHCWLLRPRRKRPRGRRAAKLCNESAPIELVELHPIPHEPGPSAGRISNYRISPEVAEGFCKRVIARVRIRVTTVGKRTFGFDRAASANRYSVVAGSVALESGRRRHSASICLWLKSFSSSGKRRVPSGSCARSSRRCAMARKAARATGSVVPAASSMQSAASAFNSVARSSGIAV